MFVATLTGAWIGNFDTVSTAGKLIFHGSAYMVLRQQGTRLTGSAGSNELEQYAFENGTIDGSTVTFTVNQGPRRYLRFHLQRHQGHLKGEAEGSILGDGKKALVDVVEILNPKDDPLRRQIAYVDNLLFKAFNDRDDVSMRRFFTKDLEFYHDRDGLTNYIQNIESFRRHYKRTAKVRREIVPDSLEVYPMAHIGALEIGVHRFYVSEPGQPEYIGATSKFIILWRKGVDGWKISRVISYDHR